MAATTSQWSRPLVSVYEVKAAWCICSVKSCVIYAERFRGELLSMGRYTNLSTFTFTFTVEHMSCDALATDE